jgi:pyruvate dehydrogenase E1 component beta subunit
MASTITEEVFDYLDAPIERVGSLDVPIPYSEPLENAVIPGEEKIISAVKKVLYRK